MENNVRKSKIYSYFYGAGNVFQQFIIVVGVLLIALGPVATQAKYTKKSNAYDKYLTYNATAEELKYAYDELYYNYTTNPNYNFSSEMYEEVEILENDKFSVEKTALNNALNDYNEAVEKAKIAKENSPSSALDKAAEELKGEYESFYYNYRYWLDCSLYEEAIISENDWYREEKTEHNELLKAYNEAVEKARIATEQENLSGEYASLNAKAEELKVAYENLYNEYNNSANYNLICTQYEEAEIIENDKFSEEKTALNTALKEYNKAAEKVDKAYKKYESMTNASLAETLFPIAGVIAIIVGLIWSFIKRFSFDKKSCEDAYDEEIKARVEEAKIKALEKLNIVAEQIDKVEPVVLNGIATYDSSANKNPVSRLSSIIQGMLKLLSSIEVVIIGSIAVAIYCGISMIFGSAFFIPALGAIALIAFLGIKIYNKYERDSYVNPRTIKKLENMYPSLLIKLGTDDNIRVSLPAITVYMFGDEQIYMYYQYFDVVTGKVFCEGIHEYFYEDIVGVVSAQETKKMFKRTGFLKLFVKAMDYLKESITVVTSGCQHSESYIVPMGCSLLDTSFVGMRNLIRQKKNEKDV